jgi:hypothetical protein
MELNQGLEEQKAHSFGCRSARSTNATGRDHQC